MAKEKGSRMIANNKKAYHDYFIEEKYEAGIALAGTEVKSLRMGKCSIKESFLRIEKGEVYIYGMHISPYEKGNIFNKDPLRIRKLLLHDYEIRKLQNQIKEKGYTLVPLQVYFKNSISGILPMPHSTELAGFMTILHGDMRFYNNLFVQKEIRLDLQKIEDMMRDSEWTERRSAWQKIILEHPVV